MKQAVKKAPPKKKRSKRKPPLTTKQLVLRYGLAILIPLIFLALFWAYRGSKTIMNLVIKYITVPYKTVVSWLVDPLPFAVAEVCWIGAALAAVIFLFRTVWLLVKRPNRVQRLIRRLAGATAAVLILYTWSTYTWGVYYYGDSLSDKTGLVDRGATAEELENLTYMMIDAMNALADQIPRTEAGWLDLSTEEIFARSEHIYDNISAEFPCLESGVRTPKGIGISRVISYMGFTGFYFSYTGEATVNIDFPSVLLPSTIAHEMSHQRGVADESEANFVAILTCLKQEDPVYQYSGAMLGYIHLSNALYQADYDKWVECYYSVCDTARADLNANNAYWQEIEDTELGEATNEAAEKVYSSIAETYGQEDIMKKYGACVDLLVAYYFD